MAVAILKWMQQGFIFEYVHFYSSVLTYIKPPHLFRLIMQVEAQEAVNSLRNLHFVCAMVAGALTFEAHMLYKASFSKFTPVLGIRIQVNRI